MDAVTRIPRIHAFPPMTSGSNVILSKVDMQTFARIYNEFENDNDYQSLQKIIKGLNEHNYSEEDLNQLFTDIKTLFLSDGEYEIMEKNMFQYLKKILN